MDERVLLIRKKNPENELVIRENSSSVFFKIIRATIHRIRRLPCKSFRYNFIVQFRELQFDKIFSLKITT